MSKKYRVTIFEQGNKDFSVTFDLRSDETDLRVSDLIGNQRSRATENSVQKFLARHGTKNLEYFWFPEKIPQPQPPPEPIAFEVLVNLYGMV